MKAAVIGPESMGLLYGSRLSACADVCLVGRSREHVDEMNEKGITLKRGDAQRVYKVRAVLPGEEKEAKDLIILFTKAYITGEALAANRDLIGKDTLILTLQNGAGHEDILREFTDDAHILIGTTTQGSYRENIHTIVNSGLGDTVIGRITEGEADPAIEKAVEEAADLFEKNKQQYSFYRLEQADDQRFLQRAFRHSRKTPGLRGRKSPCMGDLLQPDPGDL